MALPPRVGHFPEGLEKVLKTNRFVVSGSGFAHINFKKELEVVRIPDGTRPRLAWEWEGGDSSGLFVWLEKIVPGARYRVRVLNVTFEVEAAPDVKWGRPPEGCVWRPPRFWERAWWSRR